MKEQSNYGQRKRGRGRVNPEGLQPEIYELMCKIHETCDISYPDELKTDSHEENEFPAESYKIAWHDECNDCWLEVELGWLADDDPDGYVFFRVLPAQPQAFIEGLSHVDEVPAAFEKLHRVTMPKDDIKKAYQHYRRGKGQEGRTHWTGDFLDPPKFEFKMPDMAELLGSVDYLCCKSDVRGYICVHKSTDIDGDDFIEVMQKLPESYIVFTDMTHLDRALRLTRGKITYEEFQRENGNHDHETTNDGESESRTRTLPFRLG